MRERFAVRKLDHRARGQFQHEARTPQAYPAQIIAPPDALRRQVLAFQVAKEESRGDIVLLIAKYFRERPFCSRSQRMRELLHRAGAQGLHFTQSHGRRDRPRPRFVVKRHVTPVLRKPARVAPLDPPQLRVDAAHLRAEPVELRAFPSDRQLLAVHQGRAIQKRRDIVQNARREPLVMHLGGQDMPSGRQRYAPRIVFGVLHRKTGRTFHQAFAVEP